MSGKVTQFMKTQKYRFDFGTDGKLYVVIFNGKIPQAELKGLLSSLHNCLYGKIPDIIPLYLKRRHLEYSNFNSIEIPLENYNAMEWAAYLLHSGAYGKVDETLGDIPQAEDTTIFAEIGSILENKPKITVSA